MRRPLHYPAKDVPRCDQQREILTRGCGECIHYAVCGGRDAYIHDMFGCHDRCHTKCATTRCDLTCWNNQELFWERWAEVGGLLEFPHPSFLPLTSKQLPPYLSMIRSGIIRRRRLKSAFVALSLYEILRTLKCGSAYRPMGSGQFRRKLRLREDCKILAVGVGFDSQIETFWRHHSALIELLPPLDLVGVTMPNFSSFTDVPREHILYNRKRSLRLAGKLLDQGVAVVPHFNATNWSDWEFSAQLLRETPSLSVFCKEFQTGNRLKTNFEEAVESMGKMQALVGRPLHPIIVAGRKAVDLIKQSFSTFTLIDSMPSMKTNKRQVIEVGAGGAVRWKTIRSRPNECIAHLLDHNLRVYTGAIERTIRGQNGTLGAHRPAKNPGEVFLALA